MSPSLQIHLLRGCTCGALLLLACCSVAPSKATAAGASQLLKRIAEFPEAERASWRAYATRSEDLRRADNAFIDAELEQLGLTEFTPAPFIEEFNFDPTLPREWFASAEGRAMADAVLSYQAPCGGWAKHVDMWTQAREPGQAFGRDGRRIATIDNDATSSQVAILALAWGATGEARYREAAIRGVRYLLDAQYPNGGWPQFYPVQGNYHDNITFNDNAILNVLSLLRELEAARHPFEGFPDDLREEAGRALRRGIECVVACCVKVDGVPVGWGQQHDILTLAPAKGRKFEPIGLCSAETASLLAFLMTLEDPAPEVVQVVHGTAAWLSATAIHGKVWDRESSGDLCDGHGTEPLWARLYDLETNCPIFGDRDGNVYTTIGEISEERRMGYGWYVTGPQAALDCVEKWRVRHPLRGTVSGD